MDEIELLCRGAEAFGLSLGARELETLRRHVDLVQEWNRGMNLVGERERRPLLVRHVLDSLAGVTVLASLPAGSRVLDIGSGAGFPGIPLAVALPRLHLLLLDRSRKRCAFLEHCQSSLPLENVRVVAGELRSFREQVDAAVFRAVSPLTSRFLVSSGLWRRSPIIVAYKGRREQVEQELRRLEGRFGSVRLQPVAVPFLDEERTLVILRSAPA